ncbi:hypothetical protein GmHk_07G019544 [Glycine max]|nr:hypothetical protein GmHk_07G019544 [Glycine max]
MISTTLTSLQQEDNEFIWKFKNRFGLIIVQIRNLSLEVSLHSMFLALRLVQERRLTRGKKRDKRERGNKTNSHKSNKRHKLDKRQPLPKGPRYECYTPLTANCTTILKETFNMEVPIKLPLPLPPMSVLERTKHCKYHCSYDHNTKDYFKDINPINQDDLMVVSIVISNFMVSKRFEVSPDIIQPHAGPLLGFVGERVETKCYFDLMTTFGQG